MARLPVLVDLTSGGCIGYFAGFAKSALAMESTASATPASFEAALQELERLVQTLENGNLPLEEALAAYERGMALLKYCQDTLASAEQKIRILDGAVPAPLEPPESAAS